MCAILKCFFNTAELCSAYKIILAIEQQLCENFIAHIVCWLMNIRRNMHVLAKFIEYPIACCFAWSISIRATQGEQIRLAQEQELRTKGIVTNLASCMARSSMEHVQVSGSSLPVQVTKYQTLITSSNTEQKHFWITIVCCNKQPKIRNSNGRIFYLAVLSKTGFWKPCQRMGGTSFCPKPTISGPAPEITPKWQQDMKSVFASTILSQGCAKYKFKWDCEGSPT